MKDKDVVRQVHYGQMKAITVTKGDVQAHPFTKAMHEIDTQYTASYAEPKARYISEEDDEDYDPLGDNEGEF